MIVALVSLVLGACGNETTAPADEPAASTDLRVVVRPNGEGGEELEATLTCDPPGGTHPGPAAACAALDENPDALAPAPQHNPCTQIYGGPDQAEVTGTFKGEPIEARFMRTNGCEIDRWDRLEPVLALSR